MGDGCVCRVCIRVSDGVFLCGAVFMCVAVCMCGMVCACSSL